MNVFADVTGQERLCAYLESALESGRVTHAYLLVGGPGSGAAEVARRFAAALVADGDETVFSEAMRGAHPDFHALEPGGAGGYLIEQVRELVHDAELAPIRSSRKVYFVEQADRLNGAAANALLKTLEEPPRDVVCILQSVREHGVLETVRSRCEVLHAREHAQDQPANEEVFNLVYAIATGADNRTLLSAAKRIVALSEEGLDEIEAQHAEELEASGEYLSGGARKAAEQANKRELSAYQRSRLLESIAAARSWLRDCLLAAQGAGELAAHERWADQTSGLAARAGTPALLSALGAVKEAEERIAYNVTPQLAIEAMLLELRAALHKRNRCA